MSGCAGLERILYRVSREFYLRCRQERMSAERAAAAPPFHPASRRERLRRALAREGAMHEAWRTLVWRMNR